MSVEQDMMEKYQWAQANAPHPEREAYTQILRSKAQASFGAPPPKQDKVLAMGPSPNGGVEMMVQKTDGVVVLLLPDLPQVRNTRNGPKMLKRQTPLELPLVRRTAPTQITMQLARTFGWRMPAVLLVFQGRFNTASRQLAIQ